MYTRYGIPFSYVDDSLDLLFRISINFFFDGIKVSKSFFGVVGLREREREKEHERDRERRKR